MSIYERRHAARTFLGNLRGDFLYVMGHLRMFHVLIQNLLLALGMDFNVAVNTNILAPEDFRHKEPLCCGAFVYRGTERNILVVVAVVIGILVYVLISK